MLRLIYQLLFNQPHEEDIEIKDASWAIQCECGTNNHISWQNCTSCGKNITKPLEPVS